MRSPLERRWDKDDIQLQLGSAKRLVVAFSGGADSLSLLLIAASAAKPVVALHVNHGLHAEADEWQRTCVDQCQLLGVPIECVSVVVNKGGSVEERARNVRYEAFIGFLNEGDLLLLAHHADDQLETILFNFLRGSSVPGVVGMPRERSVGAARLFRPFLDVHRSSLVGYCESKGMRWIEDSSNFDVTLDRGYLRHEVIPLIEARWPNAGTTLLKATDRDGEVRQLLESIAENDLMECVSRVGLSIAKLLDLPDIRREHLLRIWIRDAGFPLPSLGLLRAIYSDVLQANESSDPCVSWRGCEIRRFKGSVVVRQQEDLSVPDEAILLHPNTHLNLGVGTFTQSFGKGCGVDASEEKLSVRFRHGGEMMRVNGQTRPLKKIMQESGVPPWLRSKIPLIYCDESLAMMPGIRAWDVEPVVSSDHSAGPQEEGISFWFEECQSVPK